MDVEALQRDLAALQSVRPDVYAILTDDPSQGLPPTEDLVETGLFSELGDGLLYLPQGIQDWMRANPQTS